MIKTDINPLRRTLGWPYFWVVSHISEVCALLRKKRLAAATARAGGAFVQIDVDGVAFEFAAVKP